jgi:hypothetical protein
MSFSIKVKEVYPLEDMKLRVVLENDITKIYDVTQLLLQYHDMFEPLLINPSLFKNVKVDSGGYSVFWNNNIDIPEVELWEGGAILDEIS